MANSAQQQFTGRRKKEKVFGIYSGLAGEGQGADGFGAVAAYTGALQEGFFIQFFANLGAFFTNADTEEGKTLDIL